MVKGNGLLFGIVGIGAVGYYGYQLKKTGDAITTVPTITVESFSASDITLNLHVQVLNQGSVGLHLSNLKVSAYYPNVSGNKDLIIQSRPSTQSIYVAPKQSDSFELTLDSVKITDLVKKLGMSNYQKMLTSGLQVILKTDVTVNYIIPQSTEETMTINIADLKK